MSFGIDDLRFANSYWYGDCDLLDLEKRHGLEFMERVYFHIVAFEANKLVSLKPDTFDLGPFSRFHSRAFEDLWRSVCRNVWAQWRYENALPDYSGPVFSGDPRDSAPQAIALEYGPVDVLSFCGGGKDSLVAMKLLERADIAYGAYVYSSSIHGDAKLQHELIGRFLDHGSPVRRHQLWMYDDFMDAPVLDLYPEYGVKSLLAAETPSSIFGALPVVLQHGYRYAALAHERSADFGNLIWDRTGEDVNHQWGKSYAAELLLNSYIRTELFSNFSYFSILKPLFDVVIFYLLRRELDAVPDTHSCNIRKPWCCRCPKCAYVWLNYMAYLPPELVDSIFGQNLLDVEENQIFYRQMLGLEDHTPFECIGQVEEARLAFELCRRKGLTGRSMDVFTKEVGSIDAGAILDRYARAEADGTLIPPEIAAKVLPPMTRAAEEARSWILDELTD